MSRRKASSWEVVLAKKSNVAGSSREPAADIGQIATKLDTRAGASAAIHCTARPVIEWPTR